VHTPRMSADFPAGFFETVPIARAGASGLDDAAVAAIRDLHSDLGIDGRVLDLCDGGLEQFDVPPDDLIVFDGDPDDQLPYGDDAFDDVLCSGGVGSFTHPRDTFADVARVLRPGGRFVCTFTTQIFTERAIRGWATTDDAGRVRILRAYFSLVPAFGPVDSDLRTSLSGAGDHLWAVWAAKR
jgi:SAM-dependent methyltransferase